MIFIETVFLGVACAYFVYYGGMGIIYMLSDLSLKNTPIIIWFISLMVLSLLLSGTAITLRHLQGMDVDPEMYIGGGVSFIATLSFVFFLKRYQEYAKNAEDIEAAE